MADRQYALHGFGPARISTWLETSITSANWHPRTQPTEPTSHVSPLCAPQTNQHTDTHTNTTAADSSEITSETPIYLELSGDEKFASHWALGDSQAQPIEAGLVSGGSTKTRTRRSSNQAAPKLVQWAKEAIQYYEGSTLVLSCSLAASSQADSALRFSWMRQGKPLSGGSDQRLSIESRADYSFLRLASLRPQDSGTYSCSATNSMGLEDRTSTQVLVNGKCGQRRLLVRID